MVSSSSDASTLGGFPSRYLRRLVRRASVDLRGDLRRVAAGGIEPRVRARGVTLDVAPGPLDVIVERTEGPPLALRLSLAPGDHRRLVIR